MAHLWIPVERDGHRWALAELSGADKFAFTGDRGNPVRSWRDGDETTTAGCICRTRSGAGETWVLVAPPASPVRVGGRLPWTGIRTLQEGEELRVNGSGRLFFSLTRLPSITPFPLDDRRNCARCWSAISKGEAAVRCPGCGAWHHQVDGDAETQRHCWTYSTPAARVAVTCARCPAPVALGSRHRPLPLAFWDGTVCGGEAAGTDGTAGGVTAVAPNGGSVGAEMISNRGGTGS